MQPLPRQSYTRKQLGAAGATHKQPLPLVLAASDGLQGHAALGEGSEMTATSVAQRRVVAGTAATHHSFSSHSSLIGGRHTRLRPAISAAAREPTCDCHSLHSQHTHNTPRCYTHTPHTLHPASPRLTHLNPHSSFVLLLSSTLPLLVSLSLSNRPLLSLFPSSSFPSSSFRLSRWRAPSLSFVV